LCGWSPKWEGPWPKDATAAHQPTGRGTSRVSFCLARGLGATPRKLHLARGPDAPSGDYPPRLRAWRPLVRSSASLEGLTLARATLHLARGCPGSWRRAHSPDQSIKCCGMPRAPESKANPRHDGPLTPPGNHIPALFRQTALCGNLWHCTGAVPEGRCQLCDTVPPTPVRPPRRTPRKRTVEPLKKVWTSTLHPRRTAP
jgi:hypothetical protein